jgi:hypothetical protein
MKFQRFFRQEIFMDPTKCVEWLKKVMGIGCLHETSLNLCECSQGLVPFAQNDWSRASVSSMQRGNKEGDVKEDWWQKMLRVSYSLWYEVVKNPVGFS